MIERMTTPRITRSRSRSRVVPEPQPAAAAAPVPKKAAPAAKAAAAPVPRPVSAESKADSSSSASQQQQQPALLRRVSLLAPPVPAGMPTFAVAFEKEFSQRLDVMDCVVRLARDAGLDAHLVSINIDESGDQTVDSSAGADATRTAYVLVVGTVPALLHKAAELEMITQTQGAEEKSLPASLSSADRVELLSDIMGELKTDEAFAKIFADKKAPVGVELLAWMERNEVVKVSTALHDEGERERVWKALRGWGQEALNEVAAYYGEGVAFYFAWVQFYQLWLLVPAIAGVLLAFVFSSPGVTVDDNPFIPFFSLLVTLWAACFLKYWDRRSKSLAFLWGTLGNVRKAQHVRPDFRGELKTNPVTGQVEKYYSRKWRYPWFLLSTLVTLCMLSVSFVLMVCSLNAQAYTQMDSESPLYVEELDKLSRAGAIFDQNSYVMLVPCIIHSIMCMILNKIYSRIAFKLTQFENYRTETQFEDALILKRVLFEALDCYLPLFYIAFFQQNMLNLRNELISLYTADEVRRVLMETVIPWLLVKVDEFFDARDLRKQMARSGLKPAAVKLDSAFKQTKLGDFEQFDDFLELTIQFGYVTLFASAFPLAAVLSVIGNMLEIRSDSYKLSFLSRRPKPSRVATIGTWRGVMGAFATLAILTNCFLFGFVSDQMQSWMPEFFNPNAASVDAEGNQILAGKGQYVVALVFFLEHAIILITRIIDWFVPDTPKSVKIGIAKKRFEAEQARKLTLSALAKRAGHHKAA